MVKKKPIRFELWRGKRVITVRDNKGKILSRLPQKGSGIKTIDQAYQNFTKTGTLNPKTAATSLRNKRIAKKDIETLAIKGTKKSKRINVKGKGFQDATRLGANTTLIHTNKKLSNEKHYQYRITVSWGDRETTGYSDIRGTEKQGFDRAKAGAIQANIIGYDWTIQFTDSHRGVATSPSKRKRVIFTIKSEVQTYVNTIKNFN